MDSLSTDTASKLVDSASSLLDTTQASVTPGLGAMHSGAIPWLADPMAFLGLFVGLFAVLVVVFVFFAIVGWKLFTKAGKPGLASLVPVHNIVVTLEIVGRPLWWIFLFFVPLVSFVVMVVLCFDLAKRFGKSNAFGFGLLFLGFIFYPILAFGRAQYQPHAAD